MENIRLESRFEVLRQLGAGGFSRVYKVEDKTQDNKVFALKILFLDVTKEDAKESLKAFNKEVEYLKKLKHNSIVRIEEDLLIDNHPAILMELVEGFSLQNLIEKQKILSAEEVMDITHQISAALLACHTFQIPREQIGLINETILYERYAIVHNDISSKNIIREVKDNGETNYKLIDFGLSYVPGEINSGENRSQGTLEYYPPEKWRGEKVDTRSDIYSFGVVLYQMLAGKVPFEINNYNDFNQIELAKKHHLESNLHDLWEIRKNNLLNNNLLQSDQPDYPYWLQLLIEKCLAKKPKDRFRTGEDLNRYFQEGRRGNLTMEWPSEIDHEEEDEWLKVYEINTINSYTTFINKYPKSKYIAQANDEIAYLRQIERDNKLEEIEWRKALESNTIELCQEFLIKYPSSKFISEANNRINYLKEHAVDWELVKEKNSKKAYHKFIKKYPDGPFKAMAEKRILQLKNNDLPSKISKAIKGNLIGIIAGCIMLFLIIGGQMYKDKISHVFNTVFVEQTNEDVDDKYRDLVNKYYSLLVDDDKNLVIDDIFNFPVSFNGKKYDNKSDLNKHFVAMKILTTLKARGNEYTILSKKIDIDSLVLDDGGNKINVYGKYSLIKKNKNNRQIKELKKIRDVITVENNKISNFNGILL